MSCASVGVVSEFFPNSSDTRMIRGESKVIHEVTTQEADVSLLNRYEQISLI